MGFFSKFYCCFKINASALNRSAKTDVRGKTTKDNQVQESPAPLWKGWNC